MSESADDSSEALDSGDAGGSQPIPSSPQGLIGNVREGLQIARWDVEAVERVSRDLARAPVWRWLHGGCDTYGRFAAATEAGAGLTARWPFTLFGLLVLAAGQLAISALATAVVHGAAKLLFRASGQYVRLLRVLWVGSIVLWIGALPLVGPLVGGVLYLLVALVAISEVEDVERLQALILVIGLRAIVMLGACCRRRNPRAENAAGRITTLAGGRDHRCSALRMR